MDVNILGTEYELQERPGKEDPVLADLDGYCDTSVKKAVVDEMKEKEPGMKEDLSYYQKQVKPKPETEGKKGFVCKVCGYIYEGEELPEDFICPLCKHGAADFEPIQ